MFPLLCFYRESLSNVCQDKKLSRIIFLLVCVCMFKLEICFLRYKI